MTISSGALFFSSLMARWTMPSLAWAPEPMGSFFSGRPKRMTLLMPRSSSSLASLAKLVDGDPKDAGHGDDFLSDVFARHDEQWIDDLVCRRGGFP